MQKIQKVIQTTMLIKLDTTQTTSSGQTTILEHYQKQVTHLRTAVSQSESANTFDTNDLPLGGSLTNGADGYRLTSGAKNTANTNFFGDAETQDVDFIIQVPLSGHLVMVM